MRTSLPVRLLLVLAMMVPVLALNGLLLHILARQGLSAFHPSVPGVITSSRLVSGEDDDYGLEVRYVYEVQGVTYTGTRYRYATWNSRDQRRMEELARRFSEGARVPVFYDPQSPGDAALDTGMDALYLFLLMFLFPFTAPALIGSRNVLLGARGDIWGDDYGPLATGIIAAGHASWVMVFVMGFFMCFGLPLSVAVLAWMVVISTGVIFARKNYVERHPPPTPHVPRPRKEFKKVKKVLPSAPVSRKERESLARALRRSRSR